MNKRISKYFNVPLVTYGLITLNIAVYGWMLYHYRTTESIDALIQTGAMYSPLVYLQNEWWRFITASFIHIGFEHFIFNMITLYFLGKDIEALLGHFNFSCIYLFACVGGNLFSSLANLNVSAGASTGIFGLFACYIILSYLNPDSYTLKSRSITFMTLLILQFMTGLFSVGIDTWGHLGGAVYGALITLVIGPSSKEFFSQRHRIFAVFVLIILTCTLYYFGYMNTVR